jgi:hypothetical protein
VPKCSRWERWRFHGRHCHGLHALPWHT